MHLCRLVYYSKYNLTMQGDTLTGDLKQMLARAICHNSDRGITSGLIFNQTFFAQVLEGDHASVTQTFVRITSDTRHGDIVLAEMEPASERLFGKWAMGYAGNTELFKKLSAGYDGGFAPQNMPALVLTAFILVLVTDAEGIASSRRVPVG